MNNNSSIASESRLQDIPDMREWYPTLNFSGRTVLTTVGDPIFVTDPIYLADIFNANDDPFATYLRQHAVIVSDFGGEAAVPVWWKAPFLVLPTSKHDQSQIPAGALELAVEV